MKTKFLLGQFLVLMMVFAISSCEQSEVEPDNSKPADTEGDGLLLHAGSIRGSLDGPALQAQFDSPYLLAEGPENSLYVYDRGSDGENRKIRKISADGQVTTIFDVNNAGLEHGFGGMTIDQKGYVYVSNGFQIKRISPDGQNITVIAGTGEGYEVPMKDGPASQATFAGPAGLVFGKSGCLYIMDAGNNAVRLLVNGKVSTVAGGIRDHQGPFDDPNSFPEDGVGPNAEFDHPLFIAVDDHDNVYVTGGKFELIRKVTPKGVVSTVNDRAMISYNSNSSDIFTGIDFANGKLYVNHQFEHFLRRESQHSMLEVTLNGVLTGLIPGSFYSEDFPENNRPGLNFPGGLAVIGDTLYTASTRDHQIKKLKLK